MDNRISDMTAQAERATMRHGDRAGGAWDMNDERAWIPCDGCNGHLYPPWLWTIDGRHMCGDCAEKYIDKRKRGTKTAQGRLAI